MTFCTAHCPDYRRAPQPVRVPPADRRRTDPPRRRSAPGQVFRDWAAI